MTTTQVKTALEEYKAEQAAKNKLIAEKKKKEKHDCEIKKKEIKASTHIPKRNPKGMAEEIGKLKEECDVDEERVVTVEDIVSYHSEEDGCDKCADDEEDDDIGVDEDDGEDDNNDDEEYL